MNTSMSAWQLSKTAPQGLELIQRPRPRPGPGEILVQLSAASLNYRDLMARNGSYGEYHPVVALADGVGKVAEVGDGVSAFKVGDRVTGTYFPGWLDGDVGSASTEVSLGAKSYDGVLADYFLFKATAAVLVPTHLSDVEAATLGCAGVTAWNALFESYQINPGETVLLLGTGGVSLFALQFAKLAGARVVITSSDDDKLTRARALGADETINYRTQSDWPKQVRALTGGKGVDLALDVGGGKVLNQVLESVRVGGTISVIGILGGFEAPVSTISIIVKAVRVLGISVGSRAMFERMNRALTAHQLHPIVDRVFPFNQALEAYAHLEAGRHFGKIAIER